ncbi:GmrSD restriction endonuclease domain-containing protein [Geoglobus acetivorans]|uniref:DUF262 domain-containing protein n=1 Tax=Geoglobus acetivorans TaxID=565033 RepID=A0ABZ3H136_GEOAI|nr:DUF262 domain-containing protein [Geoglobus acetivorans]
METNIVFNPKTYHLVNLINDIETGEIALPDLQRPFVWNTTKVRDLIDSLYKGLPVGLIILWEILEPNKYRKINLNNKREPRFLVIDGQQRLTSLYSIIKDKKIISKNVKEVKLKIAFNPIEEKFEVWNVAIEKDHRWIPDISHIFKTESTYSFIRGYLEKFSGEDEVHEINENEIASRIEKVRNIINYPFSVLELSTDLDPEEVSEIFVRINSKGESLTQSDFILTLMSVYWSEGRELLENFCKASHKESSDGKPSPYNLIRITPTPENLIRTIVAYSFLRGKLKYAYLILKGRDLENKVTLEEIREKNFQKFKEGQEKALDLTNWHDYIKIIHSIGFVNEKLISSKVAFYVTYAFYLLGKYEFNIDFRDLESLIRKWFVFSQITQRYTGTPESVIEDDLSRLSSSNFESFVNQTINTYLTDDFWNILLPRRLETSSTVNYAFSVYTAALVFSDVNVMFSNIKLKDYLNPLIKQKKKVIDLHHIFPKAFLKREGITSRKVINQVANLAYLEYKDNIKIGDKSPREYWTELLKELSEDEIRIFLSKYDLPENFWEMNYYEFLEERRKLMSLKIRDYFNKL